MHLLSFLNTDPLLLLNGRYLTISCFSIYNDYKLVNFTNSKFLSFLGIIGSLYFRIIDRLFGHVGSLLNFITLHGVVKVQVLLFE